MELKWLKISAPALFLMVVVWLFFSPPKQVGYTPKQPIAYSHKLHAGKYNIDCQYCHSGVTYSKKAGVPSLNTCMNCHQSVGYGKPEVEKIHKYWESKTSPQWVRIHNLPDHVRFSHAPHIKALAKPGEPTKNSCATCHGSIEKMEVVSQVESLNMGWCVDCHRENADKGAKINCSTCHY